MTGRQRRRQRRKDKCRLREEAEELRERKEALARYMEKRREEVASNPKKYWQDAFRRLQNKKITPAEYQVYFRMVLKTYLERHHTRKWHESYLQLSEKGPELHHQNRDFLLPTTNGFLPRRSFTVKGTLLSPEEEVKFHSAEWYISKWNNQEMVMLVRFDFPTRAYWSTIRFEKGVVYHSDVPYLLLDLKFTALVGGKRETVNPWWSVKPSHELIETATEWDMFKYKCGFTSGLFLEVVAPGQIYRFELEKNPDMPLGNPIVQVDAVERDDEKVILVVTALEASEFTPISMMIFPRETPLHLPNQVRVFCDTPFGTHTEGEYEYCVLELAKYTPKWQK